MSFQSDACQALTKVLVFRGGEGERDMDWGDGRARRDTDLQQGLFQGSLHSPSVHFHSYQTNKQFRNFRRLSTSDTRQPALKPCCSLHFWHGAPANQGKIIRRGWLSSILEGGCVLISFHE